MSLTESTLEAELQHNPDVPHIGLYLHPPLTEMSQQSGQISLDVILGGWMQRMWFVDTVGYNLAIKQHPVISGAWMS